jgi:hypothetical protein
LFLTPPYLINQFSSLTAANLGLSRTGQNRG